MRMKCQGDNPFASNMMQYLYGLNEKFVPEILWIYFLFHVPYFLILPQMYKSKINNPFFFSHNIIF